MNSSTTLWFEACSPTAAGRRPLSPRAWTWVGALALALQTWTLPAFEMLAIMFLVGWLTLLPLEGASAQAARRSGARGAWAAAAVLAMLGLAMLPAAAAPQGTGPVKIGIIGAGRMGGTLARLWVEAGHEVLLSSRHPEELAALAQALGPKARTGTPRDAALFGDVVLISIPYGALPQVGHDLQHELAGKIVLDTGNPYPERDGEMAVEARRKGTGVASAEYLPGVRLVRAFNAINYKDLQREAHRAGEPIAIPLAADDAQALEVASRLVRDAGFEPVVVGPLASARLFDVGTPVYVQLLTAPELRARLGLAAPH